MDLYWYKAKLIRVVDGDTVDLDLDLGLEMHCRIRVRLAGINAPETSKVKHDSVEYAAGIKTKTRLEELLKSVPELFINTIKDTTEKYGRYLAKIYLHDLTLAVSVSDILVKEGLAVYKDY